jgi:monofunctional biosynthetic peptidoglycan transglycosylase
VSWLDKKSGRLGLPRALRVVVFAVLLVLLLPYLIAPLYRVVNPVSTVMLWRHLNGARVEHHFVPITRISPSLPLTVIVAEDGRFCSHHGVDFAEIREAIAEADDIDEMRGGSTITQQVAKNLFLWSGRSLVRKALEFPLALWIDLVLPKRRILEIYLNIAELGPMANSVPRPAPSALLVNRPGICPVIRQRCWRRHCQTRSSAMRASLGRDCAVLPAYMTPARRGHRRRRLACAKATSQTTSRSH